MSLTKHKLEEHWDGIQCSAPAGPMECDVCHQLFEPERTEMCVWCGMTVCDGDWPMHRKNCTGRR